MNDTPQKGSPSAKGTSSSTERFANQRQGASWVKKKAEHGTYTRYKQGCKCLRCMDANAAQSWAHKNREHPDNWPGRQQRTEAICGTRRMYNRGCRCEPCVVANRTYMREYMRLRLRDPIQLEKHRVASREYMRRMRSKGDSEDHTDL